MKSVRIAPLTLSRSNVFGSCAASASRRCWRISGVSFSLRAANICNTFSAPSKHRNAPPIISRGVMARYKGANQQRQRNEDHLVNKGSFRYAPHHRQLTVRPHAADLLRVQRQIISQYPGGFFAASFPITEMSSSKVAISSSNVNKLLPAKISILLFLLIK